MITPRKIEKFLNESHAKIGLGMKCRCWAIERRLHFDEYKTLKPCLIGNNCKMIWTRNDK